MTATNNIEAEIAVLGAILVDGTLFQNLSVQEDHFYNAAHRQIYRAMKNVSDRQAFIDIVTVTTDLGDAITQIGGTTYLLAMAESVASTEATGHHERLLLDAYRARMAKRSALKLAEDPTDQAIDTLIANLQALREAGEEASPKTTYDYLLEITEEMSFPTDEHAGLDTSFRELDDMTGGLQRGELSIIAARPSVGKTAFALNLAANHATGGGSSVIFSLEMGTKQLLQRMISSVGRINGQKWRNMVFSEDDYDRAIKAIGVISDWYLAIYDCLRTVTAIRSAIRKHVHDHPDRRHVAIIDYLQLMTPTGNQERRDLEIGEITRALKSLAVELDIPIVLLSQLSRGVESRSDKRPFMSDLRESGNIEQDADVIAFLYRDDYYRKEASQEMEIILSKQRNGPTGTIKLGFNKEYGLFENLKGEESGVKEVNARRTSSHFI